MKYTVTNNLITLTVDTNACEMHSLKRNDSDYEYLWQGDPKYWSGRNPTLFPLVGSTSEGKIVYEGKTYEMKNHGFARRSEFNLIKQGNDYLLFELKDNEETLKMYPYKFRLQIKYSLKDYKVVIDYKIINDDDKVLPFSFGLHPAFNIDLNSKTTVKLPDDKDVEISDELFEKHGTYVFEPVKSKEAILTTGNKEIKVGFDGYEILAIWKKLEASFVCIEPWTSESLTMSGLKPEEVYDWKWTHKLDSKKEWNISYDIEIIK